MICLAEFLVHLQCRPWQNHVKVALNLCCLIPALQKPAAGQRVFRLSFSLLQSHRESMHSVERRKKEKSHLRITQRTYTAITQSIHFSLRHKWQSSSVLYMRSRCYSKAPDGSHLLCISYLICSVWAIMRHVPSLRDLTCHYLGLIHWLGLCVLRLMSEYAKFYFISPLSPNDRWFYLDPSILTRCLCVCTLCISLSFII